MELRDELAYFAGFFDGEGSVGIYASNKPCQSVFLSYAEHELKRMKHDMGRV